MGILNTRENRNLVTKEFEWDCGKCSLLEGEKNGIRAINSFTKARYLVLPNIFLNGDNIFHLGFLKLRYVMDMKVFKVSNHRSLLLYIS